MIVKGNNLCGNLSYFSVKRKLTLQERSLSFDPPGYVSPLRVQFTALNLKLPSIEIGINSPQNPNTKATILPDALSTIAKDLMLYLPVLLLGSSENTFRGIVKRLLDSATDGLRRRGVFFRDIRLSRQVMYYAAFTKIQGWLLAFANVAPLIRLQ